jgi:hypothetical protein
LQRQKGGIRTLHLTELGHMCSLANNIVKLEGVGEWFEPVFNICTPLSANLTPIFLFMPPPKLSNQAKNILRWKKYWSGICPAPLPPLQVMLMN